MADFLWHKVSENEKKEIEKQAKAIMQGFSKKLSKIDKKIPEMLIERDEGEREERTGEKCDEEFRKIMFEDAPSKNNTLKGTSDFIIGEKKSW